MFKHGMNGTPTYRTWDGMLQRCTNLNAGRWEDYGAAGVSVCARWRESFENFLEDMGVRPEGKTLDRYPDCGGNYEPGNCRWATKEEQVNNKKNTVWIEQNGQRRPLAVVAREAGLHPSMVWGRLREGWPIAAALTFPPTPKGLNRKGGPARAQVAR